MIAADLHDFGDTNLDRRMLHGGLPPFFLAERVDDKDYEEWMSSYWAKDLSELFVVETRFKRRGACRGVSAGDDPWRSPAAVATTSPSPARLRGPRWRLLHRAPRAPETPIGLLRRGMAGLACK
jgi:hypothetical protein